MAGSVGGLHASAGVLQPEPSGRTVPQGVPDKGVAGTRSGGGGTIESVSSIEQRVGGQREVRH